MSDTPSPDIPDPASPTPEGSPAPAAKPRRVITLPDTAYKPRQPGSRVITRPEGEKSSRLPGTYAANYGGDPNWRRGVAALWTLFGLAAVAEFFHGLFILLSGFRGYPYPGDIARLCVEAAVFLLLWVGWSWVRWVLVAVDFLFGAWYIIRTVAPLPTDELRQMLAEHPELRHPGISVIPQLALGFIYLASAGYLAFSADVIGFTRHRREEGRGWVVVPVALIVAAFVALVCALEPLTHALFKKWEADAGQFATESLRTMASPWSRAAYDQRADPDYLKTWSVDNRDGTFSSLAGIGPIETLDAVKTSEGLPQMTRESDGFIVKYRCEFGRMRCAHGSVVMGFIVSRHPFGPWRLENMEAADLRNDPDPAATVPPAPAPAAPVIAPPSLQFNPAASPVPPPAAQTTPAPR